MKKKMLGRSILSSFALLFSGRGMLLLMFFLSLSIKAQKLNHQFRFRQISVKQGLACPSVNCVMQDSRGFIWIGTNDGLTRWDGINFKNFIKKKDKGYYDIDNTVFSIAEDKNGDLWVGTMYGGLLKYLRKTEELVQFSLDNSKFLTNTSPRINQVYIDKQNVIWLSTFKGLCRIQNGKVDVFLNSSKEKSTYISQVNQDKNGDLWIASAAGLIKYNKNTQKFKTFYIDSITNNAEINLIKRIIWDEKGKMLITTAAGALYSFDSINERFTPLWLAYNKIPNLKITDILQVGNGKLWLATYGNGIIILNTNEEKNSFEEIRASESLNTLGSDRINSLYKDKHGTIWLCTQDNGIYLYSEHYNRFPLYRKDYSTHLPDHRINSFSFDELGNWWLGTDYKGIIVYNPKTGYLKNYSAGKLPYNLPIEHVNGICHANEIDCWIATYGAGIFHLNKKTGYFTKLVLPRPYNREPKNFFSITLDKNGLLWMNSNGLGLFIYNTKTKTTQCKNYFENPIFDNQIWYTLVENDSISWLCTNARGVLRYNYRSDKVKQYKHEPLDTTSVASNCVYMAQIDPQNPNIIWFATRHGLNRFNKITQKFENINEVLPLPDINIAGILFDSQNNLWISSTKGLSKILLKEKKVYNFDDSYGLQDHQFVIQSCGKSNDGQLFFGGNSGFNVFYSEDIKTSSQKPEIIFADFYLFNERVIPGKKSILKKDINDVKLIKLDYNQNIISIDFSTTDYSEPSKISYKYRLKGFDDNWIKIKKQNPHITYTNLLPGEYTFEVQSSNIDGEEVNNCRSIRIIISPPFWKTWIFVIFCIVFVFVSAFFSIKYRERKLWRDKIYLEQQIFLRTKELNNKTLELQNTNNALLKSNATKDKLFSIIAHDLRGPVGNMSNLMELLLKKKNRPIEDVFKMLTMIYQTSKSTFNLLENLLSWAQEQRQQIKYKPAMLDITEIIDEVMELFVLAAKMKNIQIMNALPVNTYAFFDNGSIHTVIRNLLSNAIKFTDGGTICFSISTNTSKYLEICVEDSGTGISEENLQKLFLRDEHFTTNGTGKEKGHGLGLTLCKDLVEKNKGTIRVESIFGKGSSFYFTLPKGQEES